MPTATRNTLSPADLAWLRIQTPESLSVTTVVLVCSEPIDEGRLKSRIEDRLLPEPRFRQRVESPHLSWARPRWVEHDAFQLDDHFIRATIGEAPHAGTLDALVSELRSRPLDDDLPLWQVHLAHLGDDQSAIVLRVHASIADSKGALGLALRLTDDNAEEGMETTEVGLEHAIPPQMILEGSARNAASTRTLCRLISSRTDRDNPLRGRPTGTRHLAWSDPVELKLLEKQVAGHDASIVDVLMSGVIGALRTGVHTKDVPVENFELRAVVPMNLRQETDSQVGTRMALGLLHLPLGGTTSDERLAQATEAIARLRRSSGQMALLGPDARQGLSMTEVEERSLRLLGKKATVMLGIADGPVEPTGVCGQPLTDLLWWPAELGEIALGVSIVTYAGSARFGICCDMSLDLDPQEIAANMAAACELL